MTRRARVVAVFAAALCLRAGAVQAHDGPPYPIVSDLIAGAYSISIWTDPDATDDGTPEGKFWVMLAGAPGTGRDVPAGTAARVTIAPTDREGPPAAGAAVPVDGTLTNQYIALLMPHEGAYRVTVDIAGPLGPARVESHVDATYDTRPAPILLVVYAFPFVAIGVLWARVMWSRKRQATGNRQSATG
ncbi:MAG: hypothetical protein IT182_19545 [Acidobacteria bacterium]|nr:hypothetical protein [Acidobacteriota bacterium]